MRCFRVLLFLLALAVPGAAQDYELFSYTDFGNYVAIGRCQQNAWGSVTIPSSINGKPITRIGPSAFRSCSRISSVTIPTSITRIDSGAFQDCSSLRSITLPRSINDLGPSLFIGCTRLTSISVSSQNSYFEATSGVVYSKGGGTLCFCLPTKSGAFAIPSTVSTVRASAFSGCDGITAITIPGSVNSLGRSAFSGCDGITTIEIPDSVTSIGEFAFSGCSNLEAITVDPNNPSYASVDGLLFEKDLVTLLRCPGGKTGHVTFPPETSAIADYALYGANSIEGVTLPAGTTEIGDDLFAYCTGLQSFTIPETVTRIGHRAFFHCYALTEIEIPDTVTSIGDSVFYVCRGLQRVVLPSHLTEIGESWFYHCESLTEITIPAGVTTIADDAFSQCYGLTSIEIPEGVTSIGMRGFYRAGLRSVTVPASVTSIGTIAFSICPDLREILVSPDNANYRSYDGLLYSKDLTTLIQCPAGRSGSTTIPASVTDIVMNAFSYCEHLTGVRFMGDAPTLGGSAGADFTVYYFQGATGFSQPTWKGYDSVEDGLPTPLGSWLVDHELPYDSEPGSDWNHDGVSLLLAYAFDLDPRENLAGRMPQPELDGVSLSVSFSAGRPELIYEAEASDDLINWDGSGITLSAPDPGGIRTASLPLAGGDRFLRISVRQ